MLFSDCNKQNMSQQSDLTREHGISLFCMCLGFKCMIFYPAIVCIPICINLWEFQCDFTIAVNANDYNIGASSRPIGGVFTTPVYQSQNAIDPFSRVSNDNPFNAGICIKIHVAFYIPAKTVLIVYFCKLGSTPWGSVNTPSSPCVNERSPLSNISNIINGNSYIKKNPNLSHAEGGSKSTSSSFVTGRVNSSSRSVKKGIQHGHLLHHYNVTKTTWLFFWIMYNVIGVSLNKCQKRILGETVCQSQIPLSHPG